jgi:hypothetical protein
MSKRIVATMVVLLLALCAAWYFLSPGYAMMQLRDAATAGDVAELETRIDFPAVRAALKADLGADADTIRGGIASRLVDAMVTPYTMGVLLKEGGLKERDVSEGPRAPLEWEIDRQSFNRFRATPVMRDVANPPGLMFERDGLSWKVVEIDIPGA